MPFDPNKPFEVIETKFDPNKPFEKVGVPSTLEALGLGAAQGASLGWGEELSALAEPAMAKIANLLRGKETRDAYNEMYGDESYSQRRDRYRSDNLEARKAHPVAYYGSEIASAMPALIATAGNAASLPAVAGISALQGGVMSLGSAEGDAKRQALQTLIGTAGGGVLGAAGKYATDLGVAGIKKVGGKVGDLLEYLSSAARARKLGLNSSAVKKMGGQGKAADITERLMNPGKYVEGTTPAFGAGTGSKKTAENVLDIKRSAGNKMGEILDKADEALATARSEGNIGSKSVKEALEATHSNDLGLTSVDDLEKTLKSNLGEIFDKEERLATEKAIDNIMDSVREYAAEKGGKLSVGELQQLKNKITPKIKYKATNPGEVVTVDPIKQSVRKQAVDAIVGMQDKQIGKAGEMGLIDSGGFQKAKDLYGAAASVLPSANQAKNKAWLNAGALNALSTIGKTAGKIGGGAALGYAAGGKEGILPGAILGATFARYGNQWMAKGIPAIVGAVKDTAASKLLNNVLTQRGPRAAAVAIQAVAAKNPEVEREINDFLNSQPDTEAKSNVAIQEFESKYAPVLQGSLKRGGGHGLAITNYLLQNNDANYRRVLNDVYEND